MTDCFYLLRKKQELILTLLGIKVLILMIRLYKNIKKMEELKNE